MILALARLANTLGLGFIGREASPIPRVEERIDRTAGLLVRGVPGEGAAEICGAGPGAGGAEDG